MTVAKEPRAESTRRAILEAAAEEFAERGYGSVNLSDIVSRAGVSKGALHFHFPSKHDLATAVIDERREQFRAQVAQTLSRRLPGLESVIDISFASAQRLIGDRVHQAGVRLTAEIGRNDDTLRDVVSEWTGVVNEMLTRAAEEGDVRADQRPASVARQLVYLFFGLCDYGDRTEPVQALLDLQQAWQLVLPGVVPPDKLAYVARLVHRRGELEASAPVAS